MRPSRALALVLLATAGVLVAQPVPRELRDVLPMLQPVERARLLEQFRQWQTWPVERRHAFERRMGEWDDAPAAERQRRRADWALYHGLDALERRQVGAAAARFAQFDAATQQALRARWATLDPVAQHGWRLGPRLGLDYPRLQPLLAQMPVDEHEAVLGALRSMTPLQLRDLGTLVWRTPPQERADLRRELVSTDAAARDAWLQARLER